MSMFLLIVFGSWIGGSLILHWLAPIPERLPQAPPQHDSHVTARTMNQLRSIRERIELIKAGVKEMKEIQQKECPWES